MGVSWQIGNKTVQSLHIGNKEVQSLKDITNNKIIWEKASAPVTQPILEPVKFIVDFDSIYTDIENADVVVYFVYDYVDMGIEFTTIEDYITNINSKVAEELMMDTFTMISADELANGEFWGWWFGENGTITGSIAEIEFNTITDYKGLCIFVIYINQNNGETIVFNHTGANINGQTVINCTL